MHRRRRLSALARTAEPIGHRAGSESAQRIMMWTTSFCDELTDDFGGAFEATSIDGCRLRHFSEIAALANDRFARRVQLVSATH
jgi:hypothetical protein